MADLHFYIYQDPTDTSKLVLTAEEATKNVVEREPKLAQYVELAARSSRICIGEALAPELMHEYLKLFSTALTGLLNASGSKHVVYTEYRR